jgi:hypothetical protein
MTSFPRRRHYALVIALTAALSAFACVEILRGRSPRDSARAAAAASAAREPLVLRHVGQDFELAIGSGSGEYGEARARLHLPAQWGVSGSTAGSTNIASRGGCQTASLLVFAETRESAGPRLRAFTLLSEAVGRDFNSGRIISSVRPVDLQDDRGRRLSRARATFLFDPDAMAAIGVVPVAADGPAAPRSLVVLYLQALRRPGRSCSPAQDASARRDLAQLMVSLRLRRTPGRA